MRKSFSTSRPPFVVVIVPLLLQSLARSLVLFSSSYLPIWLHSIHKGLRKSHAYALSFEVFICSGFEAHIVSRPLRFRSFQLIDSSLLTIKEVEGVSWLDERHCILFAISIDALMSCVCSFLSPKTRVCFLLFVPLDGKLIVFVLVDSGTSNLPLEVRMF